MQQQSMKVVIGADTDYEKVVTIYRPKGRQARHMMPKVLKFMAQLKNSGTDIEDDVDGVIELVNAFWGLDEFEEVLVPYVLNMDDEEGRNWLENNGTLVEIMEAFSEAANFLISTSFSRQEVQEALEKSDKEAQEALTAKTTKTKEA